MFLPSFKNTTCFSPYIMIKKKPLPHFGKYVHLLSHVCALNMRLQFETFSLTERLESGGNSYGCFIGSHSCLLVFSTTEPLIKIQLVIF